MQGGGVPGNRQRTSRAGPPWHSSRRFALSRFDPSPRREATAGGRSGAGRHDDRTVVVASPVPMRPLTLVSCVLALTVASSARAAGPRIESIVPAPHQPFEKDPAVIWYDNFDGSDSV